MKTTPISIKAVCGSFLCLGVAANVAFSGEGINYLRDVKPLLAENCYKCHGATSEKGGLRLDTASFALKGGDNGPALVPGKSTESLLILAVEGKLDDKDISRMPLKKPPLSDAQITLLKNWIDAGANAPADEQAETTESSKSRHWAFIPPARPELPAIKSSARNGIDRFILARLEKEGISPSPEADRITLIRRLSLDLTGLPPTLEEVREFLADKRPDACERLADRLLASPHYGERWGRHWLDVARYADSNGYSIDGPRSIWKYRDWVINAMNNDMPFDQFTVEQLAGDMLPDATTEQKIATGFHRNTQINQEGGIDKEQFRIESIFDRVNTTGTAFLGLTIGCAQCHDHKYDPVTQKEYYRLFAFFNNADEPELEIAAPEELARRDALRKQIADAEKELQTYLDGSATEQAAWEKSLSAEDMAKLKPEIITILETPPEKRNDKQKRALLTHIRGDDPEFKKRKSKITALEKQLPKFVTTMVLAERKTPRETHLLIQGDFTRHGERVTPGVPKVLHEFSETARPDRLGFARWLVDPKNPLLARVTVNRLWQQYFGKGLVETENDFGTQGTEPTHPELLDWLATEFMSAGWSRKHIHRLIVTSATYRQSSKGRSDLANVDPINKLLARQNRLRLDAEIIRDVSLAASGLLEEKIGGPSVFPPIPDGVMTLGQVKRSWEASPGEDRYRRGMYTYFWRATPHPGLIVFDAPDANSACTRRIRSNTPLQSLTLLNDDAFFECAQALAERVVTDGPADDSARIDYAFRLCLTREPNPDEKQRLVRLLNQQRDSFRTSPDEAKAVAGEISAAKADPVQLAAWTTVSRVLLNLDETITRE